jgi:methionine-S-sulfoxide reductase
LAKLLRYSAYQPCWKVEFERLRDHLDALLHPYIEAIHHVGSTSVESLGAKPILDVNIEYTEHFETIKEILENNHYQYEGEKGIPNRHAFKQLQDDFYEHHLYVSLAGSTNLVQQLAFKRALQNSGEYREKYATLKQKLIQENCVDRELYTNRKTSLIMSILKEESIMKSIVFAGGCFWGVEAYFKLLEGVMDTEVGYIDGRGPATYRDVCNGSGHTEAVLIQYDESIITLKKLLDHLFNIIDPTSINKQGNDRGIQYRTGIYNYTSEQQQFINNYLAVRQKEYKKPLQLDAKTNLTFYPAEDYHQDYLDKNKHGYCHVDLSSHSNVE